MLTNVGITTPINKELDVLNLEAQIVVTVKARAIMIAIQEQILKL